MQVMAERQQSVKTNKGELRCRDGIKLADPRGRHQVAGSLFKTLGQPGLPLASLFVKT